ncbi:hypothetical protein EDC39_11245 [Geothermobacter ehrlichii]|uniref:Lipoprotein n=1 Tax=Geothermobacter ehrlichii TaxID=213224 RepID=A0A5D3WFT3_9BACT|nr:lipoprotein [Geothermobacter ehrlichii]TYO96757.1 hypothetical protein EDC39_11245 [Geothermobacter ehrlichii]
MKKLVVLIVMAFLLSGCSAEGLRKAEKTTRIGGLANPIGAIIHAPIWVAAEIANAGSEPELTEADKEAQRKAVEEARKRRAKYLAEKAAKEKEAAE